MFKVLIREPKEENSLGLLVLLTGRDGTAFNILNKYNQDSHLDYTRIVAVEPIDEWYPAPNGVDDQQDAVWGLKITVPEFDDFISNLEKEYQINRSQIALAGFSAGAVVAIQTAALSTTPFGAVIVHNGTILEPEELPPARHKTPYVLIHSEDDDCFEWNERYLPMKNIMQDKNYKIIKIEKHSGKHYMLPEDIEIAGRLLQEIFNYSSKDDINL